MFHYSIILSVVGIFILYLIVLYNYYIAFVEHNAKVEAKYKKEVLEEREWPVTDGREFRKD